MLKKICTTLLTLACVFGVSLEGQASEKNILGLWKSVPEDIAKNSDSSSKTSENSELGTLYYFGDKGVFALPEQSARTGISWELSQDNVLTLTSSPVPAESVSEEFFRVISLKKNKMLLQNTKGEEVRFEKVKEKIVHVTGKMMYRERIALPPLVETRVQLYANGKPFAMSSVKSRGQVPLPFSLYFIEKAKDVRITLDASIYHGYNKLFGTAEPIAISAEYIDNKENKKELNVLLHGSQGMEDVPSFVLYPSTYKSTDGKGTLYLEAEGFGVFKHGEIAETIAWNQVDRNHSLEIIRGNKEPLFVSVQSESELVFKHFDGKDSVTFSRAADKFSQEVMPLTGMYTEMGAKGYFTDCSSQKQFVLDFDKNPELHKAFLGLGASVGYASIDALISRENDTMTLTVKNFKSLDKDKKCKQTFQNAGLTNSYWRLLTLNGKKAESFPDQREAHLTILDKQASGSDGCNNFFMPVMIENEKLKFGQGGSTLMMCPEGDAQAREFLQTLGLVDAWQINGSVLQLKKDDEVKLSFEVVYF